MHRVIAGCETMYFGMSVSDAYLAATVNVAAVAKHHGVKAFAAAERYWSPNYIQHSAHIAPGRIVPLVEQCVEGIQNKRPVFGFRTQARVCRHTCSARVKATVEIKTRITKVGTKWIGELGHGEHGTVQDPTLSCHWGYL